MQALTRHGGRTPGSLAGCALAAGVLLADPPSAAQDATVPEVVEFLERRWTTEDGLPQNSVNDVVQTRDGYLWLATFGGLVRFDGTAFTVFGVANTEAFLSNRVLALCEDARGRLWIGTHHGLVCHENGRFTRYGADQGVPGAVQAVAAGPRGSVWIGDRTIARLRDGAFDDERLALSRNARAWDLYVDEDEVLWAATGEGGARIDAGGVEWLVPREKLGQVGPDPSTGRPWFWEAGRRFRHRQNADGSFERRDEGFVPRSWCVDDAGNTLFGTAAGGLFRLNARGAMELVFELDVDAPATAALHDREGNLWVGTAGRGLVQLEPAPFRRWLLSGGARFLTGSPEGGLWLAVGPSAVAFDGGAFTPLPLAEGRNVTALHHDGTELWLATDYDVIRASDGARVPHGLSPHPRFLAKDASGRLWTGNRSEIVHVQEGPIHSRYPLPAPGGARDANEGFFLAPARDGGFWFAHGTDLLRAREGAFEARDLSAVQRTGAMRSLHEDERGVLWIGTYGEGLLRVDEAGAARLSTEHGLPDDSLGGILADDRGNLWINSNRGVFRASRDALDDVAAGRAARVQCRTLPTGEGDQWWACRDPEGALWFTTIEGIVRIDPGDVPVQSVAPLVAIERVVVDRVEIDFRGGASAPPGGGDLEIVYAGLGFVAPHLVHFRYRLAGHDPDWIDAGSSRVARYTNVPPGDYTFEVMAANGDGVWSETAAGFDLTLEPHFYETAWFLGLVGLLAIGGVLGAHRLRTLAMARRNAALEEEIAERQRVEASLRASEEKYRVVAETAKDAILTINADGVILFANPAAARIFGCDEDELPGTSLAESMPERDAAAVLAFLAERDRTDEPPSAGDPMELTARRKDGSELPIEVSVGVERYPDGRRRLTAVLRDVSRRLVDEQEKERLRAQLVESTRLEAVGRLAGGVAHDFNNMLTVLLGQADLLRHAIEEGAADECAEHVEEIQRSAERAAELTGQLLAFSRQQLRQPRVFDLGDVLRAMEPMLRRVIREDIELAVLPAKDAAHVLADRGQLEQVLLNLALNARDAMPAGGRIVIESGTATLDEDYVARHVGAHAGPHVVVSVTDTGAGIDDATLPHVFEPFFSTKAQGKGTGLGLASAHGIVKQSGGHLTVYSEVGRGTTFRMYLPAAESEAFEVRELTPTKRRSLNGRETVLLCDDNPAVRRSTGRILKRHGYRVLDAEGPLEALEIVKRHDGKIALLLTDVVMPDMSGRELAEEVVKLRNDVRVLYASGYTSNVVLHRGVVDDGVEFLEKPFSAEDLLVRIREILER